MKKTTIMFAVVGMLSALQSHAANLTFTFHDYAYPAFTDQGGVPFSATEAVH